MKRWEQFNEMMETPECMEEQAINMYTAKIIEHIESTFGMLVGQSIRFIRCYDYYAAIKDWLNEEVADESGKIETK